MKPRIGQPLIDQSQSVPFEFDGQKFCGHPGDTLASALLANGVKVFGRSFKYHRPRGLISDGVEEPNALMEIGEGSRKSPNFRASEQEIFAGLKARSQNYLGSRNWDFLAINDVLSPFLGAGFYYKTFKWPKAFWERLYEPLIRHAAGLGSLSGEDDRQKYDRGYLFCDVMVVGSGLAGLEAAWLAAGAGQDVLLVEGDYELGGRLIRDQGEIDGLSYREWRDKRIAELKALPNLRILTRAQVLGAYDGGVYGILERVSDHCEVSEDTPRQSFWRVHAKQTILATGATERPIVFRNNDRPGIMLAGAVRAYLNRYGVLAGEKIAIFANHERAWELVEDLKAHGIEPVAVIDPRGEVGKDIDVPLFRGVVVDAHGRKGLSHILVKCEGKIKKIACDCLAVSGGWNPNLQLASHKGERPIYDPKIASFVPDQLEDDKIVVGAAAGIFGDQVILEDVFAKLKDYKVNASLPAANNQAYKIEPLWAVAGKGRAFVDFQNDVSVKDIEIANRENFHSPEHMKRYTTLGMATDQGKTANVNALGILADLRGEEMGNHATTTFRPPFVPAPIAALGAGGIGKGFAPERFTPSHDYAKAQNASMVEVGLWHRVSYFPHEGETVWRQSCDREVGYVRNAVGVCDASSLGKIHLKGKDAKAFLDLVYTGKMSTLQAGRVRYGLMLREDGMVLDDGTCACLGENDYLITTTTAAAGAVMDHFDFVAQCLMPDADVHFISVTDHFAQYAVAGPKARTLLVALIDEDISDEALPYMGVKTVQIGSVKARLFRISFSGELGFELALPRRFGNHLMEIMVERAKALGGGAYGLEALNVMRIEKGFITHAEIDGRVTPQDLGMGRMVSPNKDCIGKVMAAREHLRDENRRQLVGLKPIGAVKKLLSGSVIVEPGLDVVRENLQGHVSSVCYSPNLEHMIGLAFVKNGHARKGEKIRAVDLVRDFDTLCEIVDPVFFDPNGERLNG